MGSIMLKASKPGLGWRLEIRRHENHKPQSGKEIFFLFFFFCISRGAFLRTP